MTTRRSKTFETPFGYFSYAHTPPDSFYLEVSRIEQSQAIFLLAEPWKALADYLYSHKIAWKNIEDIYVCRSAHRR